MATRKKTATKNVSGSTRGRAWDHARVAVGQDYEAAYEARKTCKKPAAVRKAVKSVGNSRKAVSKALHGK